MAIKRLNKRHEKPHEKHLHASTPGWALTTQNGWSKTTYNAGPHSFLEPLSDGTTSYDFSGSWEDGSDDSTNTSKLAENTTFQWTGRMTVIPSVQVPVVLQKGISAQTCSIFQTWLVPLVILHF